MIVRHGESVGNVKKILYGRSDYELTELGIQQAKDLNLFLNGRHKEFSSINTSTLKRAVQTCEYSFGHHPELEYKKFPEFQEIDFGCLEEVCIEDGGSRNHLYSL